MSKTINVDTKYCPACKENVNVSEFGTNNSNRNGLQDYCKECMRQKFRERRSCPEVRAKKLESDAKYRADPENAKRARDYTNEYRQDPEQREKERLYAKEYDNTPEGRAKSFLKGAAVSLRDHLGDERKPKVVATAYLDGGDPYAQWRVDGIVRIIEEGDRLFGRGNYQLDHGVALINGGCPFSSNNIRPVPTKAHMRKTKTDIRIHTLRGADPMVAETNKEVLEMIKSYCEQVSFMDWNERVFKIAKNWQACEDIIADAEEVSMHITKAPLVIPPLPTPSQVALAKGMIANNERDMTPPEAKNRPKPYKLMTHKVAA